MDERLIELLTEGVTLVTPAQRLSRHLRFQFAIYQINQHKHAWQTPDSLPWTAWCKRTFESVSRYIDDKPILLSQLQQQWLWQDIIGKSKYKDQLLQTSATAKQVANAYQLCKEWAVPIFPEGVYLSEDAFAFQSWVRDYETQKQAKHVIDDACLPDCLIKAIIDNNIVLGRFAFYGFDILTTQQQNLISALQQSGNEVVELPLTTQTSSVAVCAKDNARSENLAAACWAREKLQKYPDATIGIISPRLKAMRNDIAHAFQSVFEPEYVLHTDKEKQTFYSISLGQPLIAFPLIHTALNLLSLGRRYVALNTFGALLHSPFIKEAVSEQSQRANFDAVLRRVGEQRLGFKSLYWIFEQRCEPHEQCDSFIQTLKSFEIAFLSQAKTQTLRQWVETFSEWLSIFGWPGERKLNSDEYQTLMAWQKALMQLASLDKLSNPVNFNQALYQLNRLLSDTHFQPETTETPIQILGITGVAAMQFDYLWVLGMQDEYWPDRALANPFIPAVCQREYGIPTANAEAQLLQAKKVTHSLVDSAKEVVFSYAREEGERQCRPSPLIQQYINNSASDYLNAYQDYKRIIFSSADMEEFTDLQAPVIPPGEIAYGGSALFKDQAACPFKAFARHRLFAQALGQADIGLNAIERGNLAHRALQFLWQRIKTSANLQYKSEAEIEQLIQSVVAEAIKQQVSQQPETFTDRFTKLEQQRLQQLLKDWLLIEYGRNEFNVIATEQWRTLVFEDIELHLRVDRIDELADGKCVIIDYKTGMVSKTDWESEHPNDPQLPLYAITNEQQVAAIAFASLKRGRLGFIGQAEADDILPGVKSNNDLLWQEQLDGWRAVLIKLAQDYRNGNASVEPTATACRYCDLHALCRIFERIDNPDEVALND